MKIKKALLGIPENITNKRLFYLGNAIIFIVVELFFRFLNSSIVTTYKGNTYSSLWNFWIVLTLFLLLWLVVKKKYKATIECLFLILFFLNRTIILKVFLHAFFLLLEAFILSEFIDSYMFGGGFEKTSLIIYTLGKLYLYTQLVFLLKRYIFTSAPTGNI